MPYTIKHQHADGSKTVTRVEGSTRKVVERKPFSAPAVIVAYKKKTKEEWFQRFHGDKCSARTVRDQRELQRRLKAHQRTNKGMSKDGAMRRTGSIPPSIYFREIAKNGPGCMLDPKHMRKVLSDNGLNL